MTLADGTGDMAIVFLGRRHVAGIEPGTYMSARGIVGEHAGKLEMLNPEYELLVEV